MSEPASFSHSRHVELNASLSNSALLPTTERTWSWFDYLSFWMSDVHSVGTYVTLGNLFASDLPGMAVAIGLLVGILLVQILCNLVAVPSQQTGAPFPVICRASFGVKGLLFRLSYAVLSQFAGMASKRGWPQTRSSSLF